MQTADRIRLVASFLAIYLIWGSTYLAIRVAVHTIPPLLMAGVRFLVAGAILAFFVRRATWRTIGTRQWTAALVAGSLMFAVANGLVSWTEQYLDSGVAALVIATIPGWFIVMQLLLERRRPRVRAVVGTLLGFAGVAVLMYRPAGVRGDHHALSVSLLVAASLSWVLGSLYVRRAPLPRGGVAAVAMQCIAGGAVLVVLGSARGEWASVHAGAIDTASLFAMAYLVVFGSLIAFSAYQWLLHNVEPAHAGTYAFVNPAIAVFLGWGLGDEVIDRTVALAAIIVITGVVLILWGREARPTTIPGGTDADRS